MDLQEEDAGRSGSPLFCLKYDEVAELKANSVQWLADWCSHQSINPTRVMSLLVLLEGMIGGINCTIMFTIYIRKGDSRMRMKRVYVQQT
jgi:hypothetical protein